MTDTHVPVLLAEVLEALKPWEEVNCFIDATLGLAGHSAAILGKCERCKLIGFDCDPEAREIAEKNLRAYSGRFEIVPDNFRNIGFLSERDGWQGSDATLFDLGVSNLQLTRAERGFSFQYSGPLDMRMDCDSENGGLTAKEILDSWDIGDLTKIFREYGEERFAYKIAKGIVRNREHGRTLATTEDLTNLIRDILPAPVQRKMGGHPARKVFQALRIAVNDEMGALDEALDGALKTAADNGRILVISYHSLEDRTVKRRFRKWKDEGLGEPVNRKVIKPTEEEIISNYKSRSAKLRIFKVY